MPQHDSNSPPTTHDRVVNQYFETTSGVSRGEVIDYHRSTAGLRRGLGPWFDVRGKAVLDLGCGTGELCWLASEHGASTVTGVNLSQGEIEYARSQVEARFVCQDILSYLAETAPASVDRIFAMNILEHLSKDELAKVLEQAARVLREGGSLVAMVPNAISPFGTMTRYWDITHHLAFTPSSVRQLMRLCGFTNAEFREWGPRPHGVVSALRYALWQGIRGLIAFRLLVETGSAKEWTYTADMLFRLSKSQSAE